MYTSKLANILLYILPAMKILKFWANFSDSYIKIGQDFPVLPLLSGVAAFHKIAKQFYIF